MRRTTVALTNAQRTLAPGVLASTPARSGQTLLPQRRHSTQTPTTAQRPTKRQFRLGKGAAATAELVNHEALSGLESPLPTRSAVPETDAFPLVDSDGDVLSLHDARIKAAVLNIMSGEKFKSPSVPAKERVAEKSKKRLKKVPKEVAEEEDVTAAELEEEREQFESSADLEEEGEKGKGWVSGWGEDKLQPAAKPDPERLLNGHIPKKYRHKSFLPSRPQEAEAEQEEEEGGSPVPRPDFEDRASPLMYTRRIEGVLEPDKMPSLEDVAPIEPQLPVAQLKHNLERVLFNPGVHWLQDPRSRVYNFDPYVQEIPPVTDFAFERIARFTASSKDTELHALAAQENKLFSGSTSSLTPILCHIYFLLSADRFVDTSKLSLDFQSESRKFTPGQRMPASVQFNYMDGRYAVDSAGEKSGDSDKNILAWLGTMLEKFLTVPKEEFEMYKRSNVDGPLPEKKTMREAFRFAKARNFLLRSQLDCHDPRLPGTGVFDIKTRACMAIRLDIFNFEENSGYLIRKQHGKFESFEREYYDLLRSAFLKYQFQARIGNMDGVIVAYHNTKQMFGFQYIPLEEMDLRLFGYAQGDVGQRVFKGCLGIMENLAEEIVNCFPNQSVRAVFETSEGTQKMDVWVEPVQWDGPEEDRPIKQLEVRTWSYLNSNLAKPWSAFRQMEENWSIRWSIAHLNQDTDRVRSAYSESKRRQFRAWTAPAGVDADDLQEWYSSLDFGGSNDPDRTVTFNPERFKTRPDRSLLYIRRLSEKGRLETERIQELEEGMPRHVLGEI